MKTPKSRSELLEQFCGMAPLFPLPNVVAFPNSLLPLHIFEHRYRQMIESVMQNDRWLALALLQPGWETTYDSKLAAVHPMVCLGRVVHAARLEDGRFNILFQGVTRAHIVQEPELDSPYRIARLKLQPDHTPESPAIDREHRVHELISTFRQVVPEVNLDHVWHESMGGQVPFGGLCDILGHALALPPAEAQELLNEIDVDLRSDLLLSRLRAVVSDKRSGKHVTNFPPQFSEN